MANRLKMAHIDTILSLHQRKWSIRRIARELGIHRDTVAGHIRLKQAASKQARAPIGSDEGCPEAKPATQEGGAQPAKQDIVEEGAHEVNQARAPIGTSATSAAKQLSLCEPWRQVILGK